jgi:ornithine cyclodeaminase/alanine dehydrogenase-like protein (mu-crystallin family)
VDAALVARAARVLVDSEHALYTCGELAAPDATLREGAVATLGDALLRGIGRGGDADVTLFKSVGVAVQDVATAAEALRVARERGLGTLVAM